MTPSNEIDGMTPDDVDDGALGYAELLRIDGAFALLRVHRGDRVLYSIVKDGDMVFLSEDSNETSHRFDRSAGHRSNKLDGDSGRGHTRNDYLEIQPSRLPRLRGMAYRKLADQMSHWLARHDDSKHEP